jgi:hypothetical protein
MMVDLEQTTEGHAAMTTRRFVLGLAAALPAFAVSGCSLFRPAAARELYTGRAFVTGQDERNRKDGFMACLRDVVVKLSGDPALHDDPRLATALAAVDGMVDSFSYHDRMEGLPIGDEQGTRDRPFDLTTTFKTVAIDGLLQALASTPWLADRPRIGAFVGVKNHARSYVLAEDGEFGSDQRASLRDAAWLAGLAISLPKMADLERLHVSPASLMHEGTAIGSDAASAVGASQPLSGSLVWDDGMIGWKADWRLVVAGAVHAWSIRDVNFDEAFRSACLGALRILSGHGNPPTAKG